MINLVIEIILVVLLIGCIYLDWKYPCDKTVKFIVSIVVIIKIILIAYEFKRKGEKKGEQECKALLTSTNHNLSNRSEIFV